MTDFRNVCLIAPKIELFRGDMSIGDDNLSSASFLAASDEFVSVVSELELLLLDSADFVVGIDKNGIMDEFDGGFANVDM